MEKRDTFKEVINKIWPKTRKELEKGMENAKKLLAKGDEHLKEISEKGIKKTKKISLSLRKEKLYYELGKAVASTTIGKWKSSKKINYLMKGIKDLDKQINKI